MNARITLMGLLIVLLGTAGVIQSQGGNRPAKICTGEGCSATGGKKHHGRGHHGKGHHGKGHHGKGHHGKGHYGKGHHGKGQEAQAKGEGQTEQGAAAAEPKN